MILTCVCVCVCVMKGWSVRCRIFPYEWRSAPNSRVTLHRPVPLESRYSTDAPLCVVLLSGSDQLINNTVLLWCVCSGAACVSNNSSQWLISNFGQFSALVPLNQLISLNPQFNPVQSLKHIYSTNSHCTHQDLGFPLKHMGQLPEKQNWVRYWANFLLRSINWYIDALRWAWACRGGTWFCASVANLHIEMWAWLPKM